MLFDMADRRYGIANGFARNQEDVRVFLSFLLRD